MKAFVTALFFFANFLTQANAQLSMNGWLSVADLTDANGYIYLFRYISQKYVPGQLGIVAQHTGLISYTINPLIFLNGHSFGYERTAPHILISKLNATGLYFVDKDHKGLGTNFLRSTTTINDFNKLTYEVEVPAALENVIAVIPLEDFLKNLENTSDIVTSADYFNLLKHAISRAEDCTIILNQSSDKSI